MKELKVKCTLQRLILKVDLMPHSCMNLESCRKLDPFASLDILTIHLQSDYAVSSYI